MNRRKGGKPRVNRKPNVRQQKRIQIHPQPLLVCVIGLVITEVMSLKFKYIPFTKNSVDTGKSGKQAPSEVNRQKTRVVVLIPSRADFKTRGILWHEVVDSKMMRGTTFMYPTVQRDTAIGAPE